MGEALRDEETRVSDCGPLCITRWESHLVERAISFVKYKIQLQITNRASSGSLKELACEINERINEPFHVRWLRNCRNGTQSGLSLKVKNGSQQSDGNKLDSAKDVRHHAQKKLMMWLNGTFGHLFHETSVWRYLTIYMLKVVEMQLLFNLYVALQTSIHVFRNKTASTFFKTRN